jgi:hypothetical protein
MHAYITQYGNLFVLLPSSFLVGLRWCSLAQPELLTGRQDSILTHIFKSIDPLFEIKMPPDARVFHERGFVGFDDIAEEMEGFGDFAEEVKEFDGVEEEVEDVDDDPEAWPPPTDYRDDDFRILDSVRFCLFIPCLLVFFIRDSADLRILVAISVSTLGEVYHTIWGYCCKVAGCAYDISTRHGRRRKPERSFCPRTCIFGRACFGALGMEEGARADFVIGRNMCI